MSERKPGPLTSIVNCELTDPSGRKIKAGDLWAGQPVLFLLIKRPGCVLCRAHSRRIWSMKAAFDELGIRLVCLVHEWLKGEIAAFSPDNWSGDLFLDKNKDIYRALGEGKVRRQTLWAFASNFCLIKGKIRAAQKQAPDIGRLRSQRGTLLTMGGVMIVRPGDKGIQYMFTEDFFGDHPPPEKLIENCELASGRKSTIDFRRLISLKKCTSQRCNPQ